MFRYCLSAYSIAFFFFFFKETKQNTLTVPSPAGIFDDGGGGGSGHLPDGWTVGPGEKCSDRRVLHGRLTGVIHSLENVARVFRPGVFSTAQHAQTGNVKLYTVHFVL